MEIALLPRQYEPGYVLKAVQSHHNKVSGVNKKSRQLERILMIVSVQLTVIISCAIPITPCVWQLNRLTGRENGLKYSRITIRIYLCVCVVCAPCCS